MISQEYQQPVKMHYKVRTVTEIHITLLETFNRTTVSQLKTWTTGKSGMRIYTFVSTT